MNAQFLRNLERFRLVTFDVTDTLIKLKDPTSQYIKTAAECGVSNLSKQQLALCFRQHFKIMSKKYPNFGRTAADMSWQSWWLQLVANVFRCVDGTIPRAKLDIIGEQLLNIYRTNACWSHIDSASELVQSVRNAGKCVGVISNFDPSLSQVLKEMNLLDKFDFILTSYEAGAMKPDGAIFQIPLKRMNIKPRQALHIGNKFDMDYVGARNSGWSSLLVTDANTRDGTCPNKSASKHTYASLADMLKALEAEEIVW